VAPQPAQDNSQSAQVKKPQQATSAPTSTAAAPASNAAKPGSGSAPSALDANSGYFLQVGAYKTSADAEQQRARLAFQGFESKVTQRDAGGVTYYRVRIGPFSKFDDMNSARQRLSDAGVDTAVIRFTKQ
jgi:cell division protein FtsN